MDCFMKENVSLWEKFRIEENLNLVQLDKFMNYYEILSNHAKNINLTAIYGLQNTLDYH